MNNRTRSKLFVQIILTFLIITGMALPASPVMGDDGVQPSDPNQMEESVSSSETTDPTIESDSIPEPTQTPEIEVDEPEPTLAEGEEISTEEAGISIPLVALVEPQPSDVPVEPVVDYLAENEIILSDASGVALPLTSSIMEAVLTVPDPWILRGGTTFRFLAVGGCAAFGGPSATCFESATPVQAAIDFADPGETINIESGDYNEDITIDDLNINLLGYNGIAYLNSITLNANLGTTSNVLSPILYVNHGASIQDGIDLVESNGTVYVAPGSYNETASGRFIGTSGPYQFGLFIGKDKKGITLQGLRADGTSVTSHGETGAIITTNATNNFGYSGVFVEGDDVTINGLIFGDNFPSNNKTIEVVGDNFSFLNNRLVTTAGALYFDDWYFDKVNDQSHVQSYLIQGNSFEKGSQIAITSGTGYSGSAAGRRIVDNNFDGEIEQGYNANYALVSFSGRVPTVGWFVTPVGGAEITGNTFSNSTQYVRARGIYHEDQFDWQSIWCDNEFIDPLITLLDPANFIVRPFTYTSGQYIFENVRRVGSVLSAEEAIAEEGDTILTTELCTLLGLCPDEGGDTGDTDGGKKEDIIPAAPSGIIPVTGGLVSLSCDVSNLLELPDGRQLVFADVLCEYMAGFEDRPLDLLEQEIPVAIPDGLTYQSGVTISLIKGETVFEELPASVDASLRFPLTVDQIKDDYQVLRWNPFLNNGLGDWEPIEGEYVEIITETEYFLTLPLLKTGTYVLTNR